jgi:hypothetical protein
MVQQLDDDDTLPSSERPDRAPNDDPTASYILAGIIIGTLMVLLGFIVAVLGSRTS